MCIYNLVYICLFFYKNSKLQFLFPVPNRFSWTTCEPDREGDF